MAAGSKEKVLDVARDLFYRNGYQATSVDDIIAEARVSKSNFYYHFKSKEALGLAVIEQRREDFENHITSVLLEGPPSPIERISRFLNRIAESHDIQTTGCPFGNLIAEMSEHSEILRCQLSDIFGSLTAII